MIQIDELIKNAMHEKNVELLGVLKLIKAEFLKKATEPNRTSKELTEEEQMKVLMKMAAAHKDSIEQYDKAGRSDLSENEKRELDVINGFLPKEATDEEIAEYTSLAVTIYKTTKDEGYALSMKDMKGIMALVKEKYPTANGGVVSKTLKNILGVK